jgi:hypothetical protein
MRSLRAPTPDTRFWKVLSCRSLLALVVLLNLWPLSLSAVSLEQQLQIFVTMLRGRYILGFPRPGQSTPGFHTIHVTVSRTDDFVVASGVTYPVANPDSPDDSDSLAIPGALPAKTSPATFGTRPPMQNPH